MKENGNDINKWSEQTDKGLKNLCGEHLLSGVELTVEKFHSYYAGETQVEVLLFTLDGITYVMSENPDDDYRSYCADIEITKRTPKFSFPPVKVSCSMMGDNYYEKNDCIVMRDAKNGEIILEAGTRNYDDYYPYCHFRYLPENMACNQEARQQETGKLMDKGTRM